MIRLAVSVEGQTEGEFTRRVLAPHLRPTVQTDAILIGSARRRGRGGNVTSDRLVHDMVALLLYNKYDAVTSLVDYYGFRDGQNRAVDALEEYLRDKILGLCGVLNAGKVVPYVQKHEFEGLLFSNVRAFADVRGFPRGCDAVLQGIRDGFDTPEDINSGPGTAPSQRIRCVIGPRYEKNLHGPQLAEAIGLDTIREQCPRFNRWIESLESLGRSEGVARDVINGP